MTMSLPRGPKHSICGGEPLLAQLREALLNMSSPGGLFQEFLQQPGCLKR